MDKVNLLLISGLNFDVISPASKGCLLAIKNNKFNLIILEERTLIHALNNHGCNAV